MSGQAPLFDMLLRQTTPADWRPDAPPSLTGVHEVAVDFETTGLRWYAGDRPIGLAVAWGSESRYLPFAHRGGGNLDEEAVKRWARTELRGKRIINLNSKFDAHFARAWGVDYADMDVTLGDVAHYAALLDDHRGEGWRRSETPFSLEAIGMDYAGEGKLKGLDPAYMADYHASEVTAYARQDAALVLKVMAAQRPLLVRDGLEAVAALEDSVLPVVVEMEKNAARIDVAKLRSWEAQSASELAVLRMKLANTVGWNVNPDSPEHMARLFREQGLKSDRVTETGRESFASDVLSEHAGNPIIQQIIQVARLSDLRSKFLVPYNEAVGDDGLLRFEFHQLKGDKFGTVSGRFSSTKPAGAKKGANVQQVFSVENQKRMHGDKYILRELFIPEDGYELGASDAAQIEYRVFAHMTGSERLLQAYRDDPACDFHEWTGALVRKHRPDFDRKRLKVFNFMLLFGGGVGKTAEMMGVSEEEGEELQQVYARAFPEAKALMQLAMRTAEQRGYVRTITGRRARFPQGKRLHAALNRAIQGSAADLNKMKLVSIYKQRRELGVKMRLTVHDEIVLDVMKEAVPAWDAAMNVQEYPLKVPITWSTKSARNWAEAK